MQKLSQAYDEAWKELIRPKTIPYSIESASLPEMTTLMGRIIERRSFTLINNKQ